MVEHGCSDGRDALEMLLLGDRVAARPGQRQLLGQPLGQDDRRRGEPLQPEAGELALLLGRRQEGQERLADRRRVQRRPAADADAKPKRLAGVALVDIEGGTLVQLGQCHRLARLLGQPVQLGCSGSPDVEGGPDLVGQLEQPMAQPVGAVRLVEPHEAALDQRLQDAVQRALGQARELGEVAKAQRPLALAHGVQHRQPFQQRLGARNGAGLLRTRHRCRSRHGLRPQRPRPAPGQARRLAGRAPSTVVRSMTRRWPG